MNTIIINYNKFGSKKSNKWVYFEVNQQHLTHYSKSLLLYSRWSLSHQPSLKTRAASSQPNHRLGTNGFIEKPSPAAGSREHQISSQSRTSIHLSHNINFERPNFVYLQCNSSQRQLSVSTYLTSTMKHISYVSLLKTINLTSKWMKTK